MIIDYEDDGVIRWERNGEKKHAELIELIEAYEANPTKHGRWVEDALPFNGIALKVYRCTACGEPFWTNPPGYCPLCGAKMDLPEPQNVTIINDGTYAAGEEEPDGR